MARKKRIGILTAGGDCPGLNAAIRGIGKTAIVEYGMEVIGIKEGYTGLLEKEYEKLSAQQLSGILTLGGTVLGTSRMKPFKGNNSHIDKPAQIKENYDELGLDCLVCIGGNGTMKTAHKLSEEGLNVIGIPKTIDNDVWGTDLTFGFDSAVTIATEAIDRLHTTANSHQRVMLIEVMGHDAGWIALYAGIAGGGDVILLPELGYDINVICEKINQRYEEKKPYSIIVVAEGIKTNGSDSAAHNIAKQLDKKIEAETRCTVLGYIQRGGTPTAMDRVLATQYGAFAAECIANENYNQMVAFRKNQLKCIPLEEVGGKLKLVNKDHILIDKGHKMGVSFGVDIK
ncbi:MAG: 6-phosphofructokinase [Bacteroidales bacterium]